MANEISFFTGFRLACDPVFRDIVPEYVTTNIVSSFWPLNQDAMDNALSGTYYTASAYINYDPGAGVVEQDQLGLVGFPNIRFGCLYLHDKLLNLNDPKMLFAILGENEKSGIFCMIAKTSEYMSGGVLYNVTFKVQYGYTADVTTLPANDTTYFWDSTFTLNSGLGYQETEAFLYAGLGYYRGVVAGTEDYTTYLVTQLLAAQSSANDPQWTAPGHVFVDVPLNTSGEIRHNYGPEGGGVWSPTTIQGIDNIYYAAVTGSRFVIFDIEKYMEYCQTALEYVDDISPEVGPASGEGGYDDPSLDGSSDTINLPDDPDAGITNVGFVNVYKTGLNSLQNMGVELFPPLNYSAPVPISSGSTTDAIVDGFNSIVTFLANIPSFFEQSVAATLINYIIDCHVIPVTPTGGTSEAIKVGYKTLSCVGTRLSSDYVSFDCGSINLSEFYSNFADFSATDAKLFLPFVGFVPARNEWFYRDTLNVTYKFNVIDGSFMAYVRSTGKYVNNNNSGPTIVGQYSGNACIHLPITGVTYSSMVSGLIGAGSGAVAGAGSGNIAAAATSALSAASMKGDIPTSNAYSSSGSMLSVRRPYLMIERSVSDFSKTYSKERGIPSNISRRLGSVSGFAIVSDVHLDGITATDAEKKELESLLSRGVIF